MVNLQRRLVVTWLVPRETIAHSVQVLYTPYNHAPVYSVILCEATYVSTCMLSCNPPLALSAEWPWSFTCYCGNTGLERIAKWKSAQKVGTEEKNYPADPPGNRTRDLSIRTAAIQWPFWTVWNSPLLTRVSFPGLECMSDAIISKNKWRSWGYWFRAAGGVWAHGYLCFEPSARMRNEDRVP